MCRRLLKKGALLGLAFTTAATIVGHFGFLAWVFDLFAHFRVQYTAISLALVFTFILAGARRWAVPSAILAIVNITTVVPLYIPPAHIAGLSSANIKLSLVQFNARGGKQTDPEKLVRFLSEIEADLVFLQETGPTLREKLGKLNAIFEILPSVAGTQTLILVSRRSEKVKAIVCREVNLLAPNTSPHAESAVEVNCAVGTTQMRFLSVHPPPPLNGELTHARDESLKGVATWTRSGPGPAIVIGDLNTSPWGSSFRGLLRNSGLIDGRRGFGLNVSWPQRAPRLLTWMLLIPIDHCLHNQFVTVTNFDAGGSFGSDHRLVRIEAEISDG